MLLDHLPEIITVLVMLVVIVGGIAAAIWFFGHAIGRGISSDVRERIDSGPGPASTPRR